MKKFLINEKQFKYIFEALKDEIPDYQQKVVASNWSDKYLEKDVPKKTEEIVEGKWKLSNEDRDDFLSKYFNINLKGVHDLIASFKPNIHFYRTMLMGLIDPNTKKYLKVKNNSAETILHNIIYLSKENIFHPIDVKAQKTGKVKLMGDDGKPVMKDGQPVYVDKTDNNPIFIKNKKTNLPNFINSYNSAFNQSIDTSFIEKILKTGIRDILDSKNFNLDLYAGKPLFIYVTSKPDDTLNMSNSKFIQSCQNLYTGFHKQSLLANVFDKNSKVCYFVYDEPFIDQAGNTVPYTTIARRMIRWTKEGLYFDRVYPPLQERLERVTTELIEKYTGMEDNSARIIRYKPDITVSGLELPYLDRPLIYDRSVEGEGRTSGQDKYGIPNYYVRSGYRDIIMAAIELGKVIPPIITDGTDSFEDSEGERYTIYSYNEIRGDIYNQIHNEFYDLDIDEIIINFDEEYFENAFNTTFDYGNKPHKGLILYLLELDKNDSINLIDFVNYLKKDGITIDNRVIKYHAKDVAYTFINYLKRAVGGMNPDEHYAIIELNLNNHKTGAYRWLDSVLNDKSETETPEEYYKGFNEVFKNINLALDSHKNNMKKTGLDYVKKTMDIFEEYYKASKLSNDKVLEDELENKKGLTYTYIQLLLSSLIRKDKNWFDVFLMGIKDVLDINSPDEFYSDRDAIVKFINEVDEIAQQGYGNDFIQKLDYTTYTDKKIEEVMSSKNSIEYYMNRDIIVQLDNYYILNADEYNYD